MIDNLPLIAKDFRKWIFLFWLEEPYAQQKIEHYP